MQDTRSIRLSREDWSTLLLVAVQNGYPNRTEYIRATLKGDKLWSSEQPPAEIEHVAPLLIKYPDPETQHRLDAANIEIETYKAKLAQLQSQLQNTKPLPTATASVMENPQRLTVKLIVSKVSEKTRAKWETDKWKHEAMLKQLLDEYSDAVVGERE